MNIGRNAAADRDQGMTWENCQIEVPPGGPPKQALEGDAGLHLDGVGFGLKFKQAIECGHLLDDHAFAEAGCSIRKAGASRDAFLPAKCRLEMSITVRTLVASRN